MAANVSVPRAATIIAAAAANGTAASQQSLCLGCGFDFHYAVQGLSNVATGALALVALTLCCVCPCGCIAGYLLCGRGGGRPLYRGVPHEEGREY